MNPERTEIIQKALKLKELSIRGIDGEKETAIRMFSAFKEKHSITDQELRSSTLKRESIYNNMTADEFFKHVSVNLDMLKFGLLIYAVGAFTKNSKIKEAGEKLFTAGVKFKKKKK